MEKLNNIINNKFQNSLTNKVLKVLMMDRTTRKNIIWATDEYISLGDEYSPSNQISLSMARGWHGSILQHQIAKSDASKKERKQKRAEVFTPAWICNLQNNLIDEDWFGRKDVFNITSQSGWISRKEKISFPAKRSKTWKKYIDTKRLEITCGEAPYLVSPYDVVTGEEIPVPSRIGLLDRKMRIVNENTLTEDEWLKWTLRAFQSVYGYEFQGDNLMIARLNLLITFADNLQYSWNRDATENELHQISKVISWNIWQMDAMTGTIPYGTPVQTYEPIDLFEPQPNSISSAHQQPLCKIMDWRAKQSFIFKELANTK